MIARAPEAVENRLDSGERVEWWGQPRQGIIFRPQDAFIIPFSLLWAGFPTVALVGALATGESIAALPFLLLFVIPGQYVSWGRFVVDRGVRKGLFYAVTDRRCMIVGTKWRRVTRTYDRGRGDVELTEHRNGLGTIRFVRGSAFGGSRNPWGDWFSGFEQITDAPTVYRMVRSRSSDETLRGIPRQS